LAKAIKRIAVTGRRIKAAGGAVRTQLRDRSRAAGKRAHGIAAKLRMRTAQGRDEAQAVVQRITGELADLAETAAKDAEKMLVNARRALRRAQLKAQQLAAAGGADPVAGRRRGRLHRAVNDLAELLNATRKIAAQTRLRVAGTTPPGASRQVSLHDADARPIAKGRLGKPVEFGGKAQVMDNDDGVIVDHNMEPGNPADAPQLAKAVKRVIARTGRKPRTVTADRGYGEQGVDDDLAALGVRHVVIPRKGKTREGPAGGGTPAGVPADGEVADRIRRTDQHPQTRIRVGPHPDRWHRRSKDLDRPRRPGPQPGQDRRPDRLKTPRTRDRKPQNHSRPRTADRARAKTDYW